MHRFTCENEDCKLYMHTLMSEFAIGDRVVSKHQEGRVGTIAVIPCPRCQEDLVAEVSER